MRQWISLCAVALFMTASVYAADSNACPELGRLTASLDENPYLVLKFTQLTHSEIFESVDTVQGALWGGGRGRFRIEMPGQTIVSNGVLYWSYSEENRQVIIDSVKKMANRDPVALLQDPESIYACQKQTETKDGVSFDMTALDSATAPRALALQVSRKDDAPQKLTYMDDNGSRIVVDITSFERKKSLPDSLFEFHAEPGVEVITMP